jgi:hypothetical protein
VVAKADDSAQDSDETVEVDYAGPEHSLAFNPRYLTEALHSAPGDTVDLAFTPTGAGRTGAGRVHRARRRHLAAPAGADPALREDRER